MSKSILILDDDVDFNSLLTDIFTQANYEVFSEQDPERALVLFSQRAFDLVVTDQKMPNLSGAEFMRKIKDIRGDVPVIMVSGYLDNDTIRELIKEGVGGVFLKPLNVFSLLKRTAELIEESGNEGLARGGSDTRHGTREGFSSSLPFRFRSYPCKSEVSTAFAKKLHSLRNFKSNLLLIGEPGVAFKAIAEDLRSFNEGTHEQFFFLNNEQIVPERVNPMLVEAHEQQFERITLVLLEAQGMAKPHKELILKIARKEGEYVDMEVPVRFIFCIHEDLDTLYQKGVIDENLYILMGSSEAHAPPLRDCAEDIPILAQQYVVDLVSERGLPMVPRVDRSGRTWLRDQSWPENHLGLRELIANTLDRYQEDPLTADQFKLAQMDADASQADLTNDRLIEMLKLARDDYTRAVVTLCGEDRAKASQTLGVADSLIEAVLR